MKIAQRPDPEPLETDDVKIVAGLGILWAIALVVLVVAKLAGSDIRNWWIGMCGYGVALAVIGVRYCQRRRAAIARDRSAAQSQ